MSPDVQAPIIDRYGDTWVQHPDGLYYDPPYPGDEDTLFFREAEGTLGHRSVRRGDYRYFLRHPEQAEPRNDRFIWEDGDLIMEPEAGEEDEA
jgi:hypothetical protein